MLEKIMKFFKIHFSSAASLRDGTPLQLEGDLETGTKVSVITTDGPIPLPDGEYMLEDETIILVKDGLIVDLIAPSPPVEDTEGLDPMGNETVVDELAKEEPVELAQKENPEVSGDPVVTEEPKIETTGTTTETEMAEPPIEDLPVEPEMPEPEDLKVAELETKVAALETAISEIMAKLNMISEKFSVAQPIIKKKDAPEVMNPKLQNKVDLINRLKNKGSFLD